MATTNKDFRVKNGLIVDGTTATVNGNEVLTNASSINALSDVTVSSPTSGQVLKWNGSAWINDTDATSAGGGGNTFETISANGTSVVADSSTDTLTITPGDGLSIAGNATSDTITFTPNVASASANGIVTTGTQTFSGEKTFSNTITANANIIANTGFVSADAFRVDTTFTTPSSTPGEMVWNDTDGTIEFQLKGGNVTLQIGQEEVLRVRNNTASTITDGSVVYIKDSTGSHFNVELALASGDSTSAQTLGVMTESITPTGGTQLGYVVTHGLVRNIDLSYISGLAAGDILYLDGTTAGRMTRVKSQAPIHLVYVAYCLSAAGGGTNSTIFVKPQNGYELNEIHDVKITSLATDDIIQRTANNLWENKTLAGANIANLAATGLQTFSGNIAGTNLALSGKDIFSNTGTGAPTFTTYSSGVRTVFYDNVGGTSVGYSRGIDAGVLWDSIPAADAGMFFKWYGGETQVASLSGTGIFTATTIVGNTNASTITTGTIDNARTTAASANGASTIVARNENGNFSANAITATSLVSKSISLTSFIGNPLVTFTNQFGTEVGNISAAGGINATSLNVTANIAVAGNTQLGLAETQAVVDANNNYTYLTNTYTVNLALGNYFSNITLTRAAPAQAWTYVANTRTTTTAASGTFTLPSGMQNGDYVAIVIGCDSTGTYPNVTTTTYGTWTVTNSGSTTHPARLFVKRITDAANETSVAYTTTAGATAIASIAIRNAASTATAINNTTAVSASFNPPATTTSYANAAVFIGGFTRDIAVTAVSHANTAYNGNLASISTSGLAAGVNAAVFLGFATIPTASAEDPATFTVTGGTAGNSAAFSAAISSYVDPTINVTNPLLSATYPASTYVLHINNANNLATTWTGATFAWQGGTAPTLSSIQPNNIVILETIDGSTFRGALLDSYA